MNELSPQNNNQEILEQSSLVDDSDFDDIGAGIRSSFPVLSYKQSKWRIRWMGVEHFLTDDSGHLVQEIGVSLVKVPEHTVKKYYTDYDPNRSNRLPDCWSNDGVRPDPTLIVPKQPDGRPVPTLCNNCYFDAIGSRMFGTKRMKACGDFKRVVVKMYYPVLPGDLGDAAILLLVPPGSLQNLKLYGEFLKSKKAHAMARVNYIGFDPTATDFPKLIFRHGPALSDDEVQIVKALRRSEATTRIINEPPSRDSGEPESDQEETQPEAQPQATAQAQPQARIVQPQIPQSIPVQAQGPVSQPTPVAAKPTGTPLQPGPVKVNAPPPPRAPFAPTAKPVTAPSPIAQAISQPAAPPPSARPVIHPDTVQTPVTQSEPVQFEPEEAVSDNRVVQGMMDTFGALGLGN